MKAFATVNSRRVFFRPDNPKNGEPPLVLLHGLCEDGGIFQPMQPFLKGLPLLRIDLPGFGDSDLPETPGMDAYAEAVKEVLDVLRIHRCVLAGHSMGGYTALAFARRYPERLLGLGLFHSHPFADTPERIDARQKGIALLQEGKRDLYVSRLFPGLFAPAFADAHPEVVQRVVETQGKQQSAEGIMAALEGMMTRRDHTDTLAAFEQPVLWLLGDADALVPLGPTLEAAAACRVSMIAMLKGVGHMGMYEATEDCAAHLSRFYDYCLQR